MSHIKYIIEPIINGEFSDSKKEIKTVKAKIGCITGTVAYIFDQVPKGYQITALKFVNCGKNIKFEYSSLINQKLFGFTIGYVSVGDEIVCNDGIVPIWFLEKLNEYIANRCTIDFEISTH